MPTEAVEKKFVRAQLLGIASTTLALAESAKTRGGIVKYAVDWGEYFATPVIAKSLPTVQYYTEPVLDTIDSKLLDVYEQRIRPAHEKILSIAAQEQKSILDAAWFANVDSIFKVSSSYAGAFYMMAVQEFVTLCEHAKAGKPLSEIEFLQRLQQSLGEFWSDQLVAPASQLFQTLSTSMAEQKQALIKSLAERKENLNVLSQLTHLRVMGKEWEATVQEAFTQQLGSPGKAFYASLVEFYVAFGGDQLQLNSADFAQGMQKRMGALWNDSLKQPLDEFLTVAPQVDMKTLQASLDYDQDGIITLQDFFGLAKAGVGVVTNYATDKWNGILQYSAATLDYYVPPEEDEQYAEQEKTKQEEEEPAPLPETALTLSTLKTRVSKRIRKKALKGLERVRLLSATRLKEIVHVDLVAYAETMVDQVVTEAKPKVVEAQTHLTDALTALRCTVSEGKDMVLNASAVQEVQERLQKVALSPRYVFLKAKLQAAIQRARAQASAQGSHYMTQDLTTLPADVASLFAKLPALAKADIGGQVSEHITQLLTSVGNLFYWDASVAQAATYVDDVKQGEAVTEAKVEEETVEEKVDEEVVVEEEEVVAVEEEEEEVVAVEEDKEEEEVAMEEEEEEEVAVEEEKKDEVVDMEKEQEEEEELVEKTDVVETAAVVQDEEEDVVKAEATADVKTVGCLSEEEEH